MIGHRGSPFRMMINEITQKMKLTSKRILKLNLIQTMNEWMLVEYIEMQVKK